MEKKIRLVLLVGVMSLSFSVMAGALEDCIKGCDKKYTAGSAFHVTCVKNCNIEY